MPLLNDTPLANEQLSASQPLIRTNFQSLNPCVGGIFNQQGAGGLGTAATELAVYNRVVAAVNQLCLRKPGVGPGGVDYPITRSVFANPGYVFLPAGNIIIKFGQGTVLGGNQFVDVNYHVDYPFNAAPYVVITPCYTIVPTATNPITYRDISGAVNQLLTLRIYKAASVPLANGVPFQYIAIGQIA